ncbi:histidine utilization repressor [Rothia sp. HC945]|uniref:histidine utilization repressor n=1 Tax=Rothia sp. HC945 TaxID=3171170 RepID=UPI00264E0121|nr:histidine utilization repressor [Kocuria sp.]MDN5618148.1 histidine utilization repressor [Kocuria sp.]MDN5655373.1 histidine utilization repressor [Kocuria sp.]
MDTQELTRSYLAQGTHSGPAYRRIMEAILAGVESGTWSAGEQVPSENELVEALDLSRMTINRAYRELTTAGVLKRVRGVGTFIAEFKMPSSLVEIRNIADEIHERGHSHRTDVLFAREETVEEDAPWLSAEGITGTVFHSLVVHYDNDAPLQIEDRFVAPSEAPGYLDQDFTTTTPNDYLTRVAPLTRGKHIVEAVLGTSEECRLLEIDASEPCLLVRRRTWSKEGLVSLARLVQPGSRGRLEGEFGQS